VRGAIARRLRVSACAEPATEPGIALRASRALRMREIFEKIREEETKFDEAATKIDRFDV